MASARGGPAARHFCVRGRLVAHALSPLVQECAEEWVVEFVTPAPDANEQSLFREPLEINAIIRMA